MGLIAIEEQFVIRAPVAPVWDHLLDPRRVVTSVPGAELDVVVNARTYLGRVRVKVGPFPMAFRGRVHLAHADEAARLVRIVGQAHENSGKSSVRMTLMGSLATLPNGDTQLAARVEVEVAGRLIEFGRGFLQELGHRFFQEFGRRVVTEIEAHDLVRGEGEERIPAGQRPLQVLPIVAAALRAWVTGLIRRPGRRGRQTTDGV